MQSFSSLTEELQQWAVRARFEELVTALVCGLWQLPNEQQQKKVNDWLSGIGFHYKPSLEEVQAEICKDDEITFALYAQAEEDARTAHYASPDDLVVFLPGDDA